MTCREKLRADSPDCVSPEYMGGCEGCPYLYGYLPGPAEKCTPSEDTCRACWDQEIEEKIPTTAPNYKAMYEETLCKLEEANAKIRDTNHREEIWLRKQSYYRGVTEALELVYGRKLGFLQCGGTE